MEWIRRSSWALGVCLVCICVRANAETPVNDQAQGTVWLVVTCLGIMFLAGLNTRKPRPRRRGTDREPSGLTDANDLTEPHDTR